MEIKHIDEAAIRFHGVYAHGDLETEIGFDLIGGNEIPKDGTTQATYKGKPVLLCVWTTDGVQRGYAVLLSDHESLAFVTSQLVKKPERI